MGKPLQILQLCAAFRKPTLALEIISEDVDDEMSNKL
jgi:hypothetical protein